MRTIFVLFVRKATLIHCLNVLLQTFNCHINKKSRVALLLSLSEFHWGGPRPPQDSSPMLLAVRKMMKHEFFQYNSFFHSFF